MGKVVENAKITYVQLGYEDHGILTLMIGLEGDGWGCAYGGYALDYYDKSLKKRIPTQVGFEAITEIMNTFEVTDLYDLKGQFIRVEFEGGGCSPASRIGHLMKNKWFSFKTFFEKKEAERLAQVLI